MGEFLVVIVELIQWLWEGPAWLKVVFVIVVVAGLLWIGNLAFCDFLGEDWTCLLR